jgi:mRNA-degrading endonuclease HigB of HigAB toxin-antitoxin module
MYRDFCERPLSDVTDRLVVDMRYDLGRIYIRHVLTHEEYDRRTQADSL